MNFFELFGIKPSYFLKSEQLEKKFYELSRILHPDKVQTKSIEELTEVTRKSALLNMAFKILKNDDERAHYLFELAHFNLGAVKKSLPPELAEEYFNLQEVLEEEGNKSEEIQSLIQNFSSLLEKQVVTQETIRDEAFRGWEMAQGPLDERAFPFFTRAYDAIQQKNYLESMADDLEKKWPA